MLGLAAFVLVGVRFLTLLRGGDWDGVLKTAIAWAAGIGAVCLYAHTGQADTITVGEVPLALLNGFDQVVLGVSVGSVAGGFWLATKAVDQHQTSAQPALVEPTSPPE